MLVRGINVDDGVDQLARGNRRINGVEEADELLMAAALHVAADDGAIEHVESGKQCGGAVTLVAATSIQTAYGWIFDCYRAEGCFGGEGL
jgi:hypothetical protein